jgi:hypothetical protein
MDAVRINTSPFKGEVGRGMGFSGGCFVDQTAVRAPSRPIANVAFATFPLKGRERPFMRLPWRPSLAKHAIGLRVLVLLALTLLLSKFATDARNTVDSLFRSGSGSAAPIT